MNINNNIKQENHRPNVATQLERVVSWQPKTKEQIFEEIENQFEYKLNIEVDCYWKLPPKDRAEEMKRKQVKLLIKSRIAKFLNDKENCAKLMNVMLSS
ncbi:MAG: hypothetical protein ABIJ40_04100 [Bacteroidota bacterium]